MRVVVFSGAGGAEVAALEERPDPVPTGDELLVRVRHAALNPADLAQRAGHYPAPPGSPADVPGIEVAGEVIARGPFAREHPVGARVFGIVGGGGLADRVLVPERHVAPVPDELDDLQMAAAPEAFITAHDAVVVQAGLALGDVLLVNGANGGVGTAAIELGMIAGAYVVASVRSVELHPGVAALGARVVHPDDIVRVVAELGGANVILELVGAPNWESDIACLAQRGRIALIGIGGGKDAGVDLLRLMAVRATVIGSTLRSRLHEEKAAAVQAFRHGVVPHLAAGRLQPLVDTVFPVERFDDAFERLGASGKLGKVILDFGA